MNIRLAFYKVKFGDWFGMLIGGYTWLFNGGKKLYSHVEIGIYINEELLKYIQKNITEQFKYSVPDCTGWWYFSSTTRNRTSIEKASNGTRWVTSDHLLKHRDNWDVYECKSQRDSIELISDANSLLGKQYDWIGIAGFVSHPKVNHKDKWYCSESCWKVITGVWRPRVSPIRMYKDLNRLYKLLLISIY